MTVDSEPPLAQWSETFSNSYGKGNSIMATIDGGYAFAGVSNQHFLLARIDSLGEVIWWKTYQTGEATCVIQTSEGGFALAGSGEVNFIETDSPVIYYGARASPMAILLLR